MKFIKSLMVVAFALPLTIIAQEDSASASDVEEVVVVGSQIKGANIAGVLPVTVISAEDIEALGVDSGDELLENIAEQGLNYFNESEMASGGVNASRGDMGAYNLRNLGVGNTLTLLNGRRLVLSPGYQTEKIGGDFVPTMTVNSQLVPVYGLERMEILRDGASAIYGADAVAGVVNNVMQNDYEGLVVRAKVSAYDHFETEDNWFNVKWGKDFGKTNVSVFFDHYDRGSIDASEDPRWGDSDHRKWVPEDSPWFGSTSFRNTSTNSLYGQFDMVKSSEHGSSNPYNHDFTDSNGEFEVFPLGDPRCSNRSSQNGIIFDTGYGTCIAQDGNGVERYNLWGLTEKRGKLERQNLLVFINSELSNGVETFTEIGYYTSDSERRNHPSYAFTSSKHRVGPDNYWLNQMTLPDGTALFAGYELYIDNYRYAEVPRMTYVDKETYRFLQGFRGTTGNWDWETALVYSKATADDVTKNRISNTLLKEALFDDTPAAYNPFSAGVASNIERVLVDVSRNGMSSLKMFDFKMVNQEMFTLPAGPVAMLVGFEIRDEVVSDDRDDRLDGTIDYCDYENDCYPLVADVVNSSPTGDVSGERQTTSIFLELNAPITDSISSQLAIRHESSDDFASATVGKFAVGWEINPSLSLRASASTAFRAPNIIQLNEGGVVRSGTRDDWVVQRVQDILNAAGGYDGDTSITDSDIDSAYTIQRRAVGGNKLDAEESTNSSIGFVYTPESLPGLMVTVDNWEIEKEKTIGLFGRENQIVNDMLLRFENGLNNCDSFMGDPLVVREPADAGDAGYFIAAGICPAGVVKYVQNDYTNMATRTLSGTDVGIYYDIDTKYGDFGIKYIGSKTDEFTQDASGEFAFLQAQKDAGNIPANIPLDGFGDLLGMDGNYDTKHTLKTSWRMGNWGATMSMLTKGEFYQNSLTLSDGTRYIIPEMTTIDATVSYNFRWNGNKARVRFAIKNLEDERAPLADRYYGYFADAHQDYGRNYYVDLRLTF
jgi:outer membrane receptor protein involved in Fe transport